MQMQFGNQLSVETQFTPCNSTVRHSRGHGDIRSQGLWFVSRLDIFHALQIEIQGHALA